jgi:hypothetical protein
MNNLKKIDIGQSSTHSLGGGEWSIEVYHENGDFIKEFVGSNGTRSEKDDLWGEYDIWFESLSE